MTETDIESVEDFRLRVREWLVENIPRSGDMFLGTLRGGISEEEELASIAAARELQRKYYEAGFAGI